VAQQKMESHGKCPVCDWEVKKGTEHKHKGVKAWYHDSCYTRFMEKQAKAKEKQEKQTEPVTAEQPTKEPATV